MSAIRVTTRINIKTQILNDSNVDYKSVLLMPRTFDSIKYFRAEKKGNLSMKKIKLSRYFIYQILSINFILKLLSPREIA